MKWAEEQCAGHKLLPREECERSHETKLMTEGKLYEPAAPELCEARLACRILTHVFNQMNPADDPERGKRRALLKTLLDYCPDDFYAEPNLRMDYGRNTRFGHRCSLNYDCVILDVARVTIGDNFFAAPGVHLYTATHPTDPALRCFSGRELGFAITIGDNVWMGGRSVVCPGVHIGDNVVVGAGSVVVHDVPSNSIIVGNPARIVKTVNPPAPGLVYDFLAGPQPFDYDKDGHIIPPVDPNHEKDEKKGTDNTK